MLSLVIPVYKNENSLSDLLRVIVALNLEFEGDFEAVFVVDGSPDRCYEILRDELCKYSFKSKLILLSRNFGSFAAIRNGFTHARGEFYAVMAADLQEPPELVIKMHSVLKQGAMDVVIATRESRKDPIISKISSRIFWGLYRSYIIPEMPEGGVDIFACNKQFRDQLLQLEERHSSLIAQLFWLGFRRGTVSYVRQERKHGVSAWTFQKKVNYLMDSVFSFTDLPVQILLRIGSFATIASGAVGVFVFFARFAGYIQVPGYAGLFLIITFFGALNLFSLGIIGSYSWRTYENTKARPLSILLRFHQFNVDDGDKE